MLTDDGLMTDTLPFTLVDGGCGGATVTAPNGPARVVNVCDRSKVYLTDADDGVPYYYYSYPSPYAYPYVYPYSDPYVYPYPYSFYYWGPGGRGFDRDDFRGGGSGGTATPFIRGGGERGFHSGGGGMGHGGGGGHRL